MSQDSQLKDHLLLKKAIMEKTHQVNRMKKLANDEARLKRETDRLRLNNNFAG